MVCPPPHAQHMEEAVKVGVSQSDLHVLNPLLLRIATSTQEYPRSFLAPLSVFSQILVSPPPQEPVWCLKFLVCE